jgi:hypothetical protein
VKRLTEVHCQLQTAAEKFPKLGWEQSLRIDVVFRQIVCELLRFVSAWYRSDKVLDKAATVFVWTETDDTKEMVHGK